jgi:hypothetical protein
MNLAAIVTNLRVQDVLDILFLTILAYYLFLWFRGTKAFNALVGSDRIGDRLHLGSNLGPFYDDLGFPDFLASFGDPAHHSFPVRDSSGP